MNPISTVPFAAAHSCGQTTVFEPEVHESTYGLLVRSEEKSLSFFETAAYLLCILSAIISICQFARQSNALPVHGVRPVSLSAPAGNGITAARS